MITVTESNFELEVLNAQQPVLLDFYGAWCPPCHVLAPILQKIADENPNFVIGKVNIDENPELTAEYRINAIPTLLFFKDGKLVNRMVGLQSETVLVSTLESLYN